MFCAVRCLIIICFSLLFVNYCTCFLIFFVCLFSCFVCLLSILCILWFCTFLCIVFPYVYNCIFTNFLQVYRPLPLSGDTIAVNKYYTHTHTYIYTRVGTLIVATIYLQLIQNRYMFRSFTVLQCNHQHCVQSVAAMWKS